MLALMVPSSLPCTEIRSWSGPSEGRVCVCVGVCLNQDGVAQSQAQCPNQSWQRAEESSWRPFRDVAVRPKLPSLTLLVMLFCLRLTQTELPAFSHSTSYRSAVKPNRDGCSPVSPKLSSCTQVRGFVGKQNMQIS